jgi:hypothetical protein
MQNPWASNGARSFGTTFAPCGARLPTARPWKSKSSMCTKKRVTSKCSRPPVGQSNRWRTSRVLIPWPSAGAKSAPTAWSQLPKQQNTSTGSIRRVVVFPRLYGSCRAGKSKSTKLNTSGQKLAAATLAWILMGVTTPPSMAQEAQPQQGLTADSQGNSLAQGELWASAAENAGVMRRAVQNPVASLVSVPVQENWNFGIGPNDRIQNVMNIQPVIPLNL